ncbi:MAG: ParA family protein [Deltaproteobacteria bacterium]|nr:ParA family protein [Deltaproteobacteria bacterium]
MWYVFLDELGSLWYKAEALVVHAPKFLKEISEGGFMKTIAIANQKGGCGKTTTAINLSSCLVQRGQKVLLIDCDPQAHASMGLGVDPEHKRSMYSVMTPRESERLAIENIVIPIKENFDLAPSNVTLSAVEQEFASLEGRESKLAQVIETLEDSYDYVIIDCPPSIGHLCFNALRASGEVIIPIDMSLFSLRGVARLSELVMLLKDQCDHKTKPRALVTMYDYRTRYSSHVLEKVKEQFGDGVFDTVIRYNIRLRETVDHGLPVGDYDKHAIGYKDYDRLAKEIITSQVDTMADVASVLSSADELWHRPDNHFDAVVEASILEENTSEAEDASDTGYTI